MKRKRDISDMDYWLLHDRQNLHEPHPFQCLVAGIVALAIILAIGAILVAISCLIHGETPWAQ